METLLGSRVPRDGCAELAELYNFLDYHIGTALIVLMNLFGGRRESCPPTLLSEFTLSN